MFATGVKMVDGNGGFCPKAAGHGLAPILSTDCLSPQTAGLHFLNFSRLPKMIREDPFLCFHVESSKKIITRKCFYV
ncbi:hypothetical protein NC652_001093 [Populus alba x Populus x berolinensis]|nr:hypothetical protein NC652_001093 [Populus alba x Populus x berolinensis]